MKRLEKPQLNQIMIESGHGERFNRNIFIVSKISI